MINDLDETIKQLLITKGALEPAEVDISFDAPDREWSASVNKPTVNLYLYDIRENHRLRGTEWLVSRDENGSVTRKKNPNRIDVSYMVTVWANDAADEHRLLWRVMLTLFQFPELPEDILSGDLVGLIYPVKTTTAQPDGLFNNPSEFWSALDNKIKASVYYVVTVPLDIDLAFTATMVKTKVIDVKPPETDAERIIQIAGLVHEAGHPDKVMPEARIVAREAGLTARADDQGVYSFPNIIAGEHTFQIEIAGKKVKELAVTVPSDNYDLEI